MRPLVSAQGPGPGAPAALGSWLVPGLTPFFGGWASRGTVDGQPGTQGIPAPVPAGVPQDYSRRLHGSQDAPPVIFPALYYQQVPQNPDLSGPVSVVSDNMMPVPAKDPRGRPWIAATPPPRIGSQGQVTQPYVIQSWPKWVQNG